MECITQRPRRNRRTPAIRQLVQETELTPSNLVAPLFVCEGESTQQAIPSMPHVFRHTKDLLVREVAYLYEQGIRAINLFAVVPSELKDARGSEALREGNLLHQSIQLIKKFVPDICLMVDIALDPYTTHGHDGLVDQEQNILNDETLAVLAEMSLLAAEAGADMVAPSDMMDGRIGYIREALDKNGFQNIGILSYTAKYASSFYGPFREALGSTPQFGDKKTYQLNPANSREALIEAALDESEGADMLLVKPAMPYLDVLSKIKEMTPLPVGAYQVSGEYAMIMAAHEKGWIDGEKALKESLLCIKRAGADFIFTYATANLSLIF